MILCWRYLFLEPIIKYFTYRYNLSYCREPRELPYTVLRANMYISICNMNNVLYRRYTELCLPQTENIIVKTNLQSFEC